MISICPYQYIHDLLTNKNVFGFLKLSSSEEEYLVANLTTEDGLTVRSIEGAPAI